jgi:hypothetical protein
MGCFSAGAVKTLVSVKSHRTNKQLSEVADPFQDVMLSRLYLAEVPGESKVERWCRFGHNVVATMVQSVQESTQKTYGVGWRRWLGFSTWFGTDPYLRAVPTDWFPISEESPTAFKDFVVISFMQHLCIDEMLCPDTVGVYLSAVRYYFKVANRDTTFLESAWISSARTAMTLKYRRDNPVAGKKALPFTCDMLVFARSKSFNTGSEVHRAINSCMEFSVVCMARVSEAIPGAPEVDHWLRSDDVQFGLNEGVCVVPSYEVEAVSWSRVQSVVFTVRSAKNDIQGEGHRFEYFTHSTSNTRAFDIVEDMYLWACRAQLKKGQPFFSYRGEWTLSYGVLSKAIKKVATDMGLDARRYRPHSLRIGGASMLAAAGLPDYVIQKQGRWKSLAFLEYIRLGKRSFAMALDAMVNPVLLTVGDVGRWHAGVDWREGGA